MKANVMDTIQGKLPSQAKQMTSVDILRKALPEHKTKMPEEMMLNIIGARLENPKRSVVQIGNTVFLTYRPAPGVVEFDTYTVENKKNLTNSMSGFFKFLKNQNIKKATTTDEPLYVDVTREAARIAGTKVNVGQKTEKVDGKIRPVYAFEVTL